METACISAREYRGVCEKTPLYSRPEYQESDVRFLYPVVGDGEGDHKGTAENIGNIIIGVFARKHPDLFSPQNRTSDYVRNIMVFLFFGV